jgi:hypothetical protein
VRAQANFVLDVLNERQLDDRAGRWMPLFCLADRLGIKLGALVAIADY